MKKAAGIFLAVAVLLWGVYYVLNRKPANDKYIGKVFVTYDGKESELKGYVTARQYEDQVEHYEAPVLMHIRNDLLVLRQSISALPPMTTTTVTGGTTASTTDQTTYFAQKSESLGVRFQGEILNAAAYTVYDENQVVKMEPRDTMRVPSEPGTYYVKIAMTWGKRLNNVDLVYYFRVDVAK